MLEAWGIACIGRNATTTSQGPLRATADIVQGETLAKADAVIHHYLHWIFLLELNGQIV